MTWPDGSFDFAARHLLAPFLSLLFWSLPRSSLSPCSAACTDTIRLPGARDRAVVSTPTSWGPGTLYDLHMPGEPLDDAADNPSTVDPAVDLTVAHSQVCTQLLESLSEWNSSRLVPWGGSDPASPLTPDLRMGVGCDMIGTTPQGWPVELTAYVKPTVSGLGASGLTGVPAGITRVIVEISTPTQ
jgi:hypothetical protein